MNRFFFRSTQKQEELVVLNGEDAHHLSRVLRCAHGDKVELCDERGHCSEAEIIEIDRQTITCRLGMPLPQSETNLRVTLAFALPKGEKTDFILQKGTEVGVSSFIIFYGERSIVRPSGGKESKKMGRRQKIVSAAAAQSRRQVVPDVTGPFSFQQLVNSFSDYKRVLFFHGGKDGSALRLSLQGTGANDDILLITGPEGGFSENEAEAALAKGAHQVSLGPRILRAETAAVIAAALVIYEAGEMEVR